MAKTLHGAMPSLLIVDDLPAIHEMIKSLVGPTGYLCAGAANGEEALLRVRQSHFDVVIVDYAMMPMDGITLIHELLKFDETTVVLLMSGFVDQKLQTRAEEAGAWRVLEKPFRFDFFLETLEAAVEAAREKSATRRVINPDNWPSLALHLAEREKAYVQLVLEAVNHDRERAARILGVATEALPE